MIVLTKENFKTEVLDSNIPVLVDFFATWCSPCRALVPVLENMNSEANGKYKVVKLDTDDNPDLTHQYQVSAIPTILVFKDGVVAKRLVGLQNKAQLNEAIS